MLAIDEAVLKAVAPGQSGSRAVQQATIIAAIGGILRATLGSYDINTPLRIAHFLAQICTESDGFCTTVEYASGAAYEGRADLGNTEKGDGVLFKGRGLIQLTGRANYQQYGALLGLDLIGNPQLAGDPKNSLVLACEFWKQHSLNPPADQDDIMTITRIINGGLNGLDQRRSYLVKAKAALARLAGGQVAANAPTDTRPVLQRGSQNDAVGDLQRMLQAVGFPIGIDGDFSAATELAVAHFQASKNLTADGIVGPVTWDALTKATAVKA
jgi:putative chitinase